MGVIAPSNIQVKKKVYTVLINMMPNLLCPIGFLLSVLFSEYNGYILFKQHLNTEGFLISKIVMFLLQLR